MYLGLDIGGTKTFVASIDANGVIQERHKLLTPTSYAIFLEELAKSVDKLSTKKFIAAAVGVPAKVDRDHGIGLAFGSLTWQNIPIRDDVQKIGHCPVVMENDANLARLSEAMPLKDTQKGLALTPSTSNGTGFILDQQL